MKHVKLYALTADLLQQAKAILMLEQKEKKITDDYTIFTALSQFMESRGEKWKKIRNVREIVKK